MSFTSITHHIADQLAQQPSTSYANAQPPKYDRRRSSITSDSGASMIGSLPLDHRAQALLVSPVRGQLEPHEADHKPGWRFIQCTDTPNELKVCSVLSCSASRRSHQYFSKGSTPSQHRTFVQPIAERRACSSGGLDLRALEPSHGN